MMRLFCLGLLVGGLAAGQPIPTSAAVKTVSTSTSQGQTFNGSGLLFQRGGTVYVLTSDHVILHGTDGYVHKVSSAAIGTTTVSLLFADWGYGLALLRADHVAPTAGIPTFEDLRPDAATQGESVTLVGFPAEATTPIEDHRGHVDNPLFPSPLFVSIPNLIQVSGAQGEFGMSGGPLFSAPGRFLGMLSHQIVTQGGTPVNELLILPGAALYDWLSRYFANPQGFQSPFSEPPQLQFDGGDQVYAGDQWFMYLESSEDTGVTISDLGKAVTPIGPIDAGHYLDRARALFHQYPNDLSAVDVSCFRRTGDFWDGCAASFSSLAQFFRYLQQEGLEPVGTNTINNWDQDIEKLYQEGVKLANGLALIGQVYSGDGSLLYNRLTFLGYRLPQEDGPAGEQTQFAFVKAADLQFLLNDPSYQKDWAALNQKSPGGADAVRQALQDMIPVFQHLTL
jgi:hypothetical protein